MRPLLKSFLPFAQKKMKFDKPIRINFVSDPENAKNALGKTGFYDPNASSMTIYTDRRHPKDILRSISHELVHHSQNCRGEFDNKPHMGEDYFQYDKQLRKMESEAYELGNMYFRDWEEKYRFQLQESIYYQTGDILMNDKDWKNQELFQRLMEGFGYGGSECGPSGDKMPLEEAKPDFPDIDGDGDTKEPISKAAKEKKGKEPLEEEENLEEGGAADRPESKGKHVDAPDRGRRVTNEDKIRRLVREAIKKAYNK